MENNKKNIYKLHFLLYLCTAEQYNICEHVFVAVHVLIIEKFQHTSEIVTIGLYYLTVKQHVTSSAASDHGDCFNLENLQYEKNIFF